MKSVSDILDKLVLLLRPQVSDSQLAGLCLCHHASILKLYFVSGWRDSKSHLCFYVSFQPELHMATHCIRNMCCVWQQVGDMMSDHCDTHQGTGTRAPSCRSTQTHQHLWWQSDVQTPQWWRRWSSRLGRRTGESLGCCTQNAQISTCLHITLCVICKNSICSLIKNSISEEEGSSHSWTVAAGPGNLLECELGSCLLDPLPYSLMCPLQCILQCPLPCALPYVPYHVPYHLPYHVPLPCPLLCPQYDACSAPYLPGLATRVFSRNLPPMMPELRTGGS